jgi:hypothetical protein
MSALLFALALDASVATSTADAGRALALDAGAIEAGAVMPAGHPAMGGGQHGRGQQLEDMFEALPDNVDEDPKLPSGTIEIELRDENDKPMPGYAMSLGILHQSVAKGESREHRAATTDGAGKSRFDGLQAGSDVAYRISATREGASYGARPFNLSPGRGTRVVLHVYPATGDIKTARVVIQGVIYVDLKDDRLQVQQLYTVLNFGRMAWVPKDLLLPLPSDFTALRSQQGMSDVGVDEDKGKGAKVHGTFSPGRNDIEMSWQVPYHGSDTVDLTVGLPPHLAVLRVMAVAAPQMHLSVDGFPASQPSTDQQGQHVLVTQREAGREQPALADVRVHLSDIPTQGPGPRVVTVASLCVVLLGLVLGFKSREKRRGGDAKAERARLLAELDDLEQAHASKVVGPKTYERARREIVDAIARTL